MREPVQVDCCKRGARDCPIFRGLPLESSDMRMAADHRGVEHGRGEDVIDVLRHQGQAPRNYTAIGRLEVLPVEHDPARGGGAEAGQRMHRQGLSRAVLTEDGQ